MTAEAGSGHPSTSLSSVEIVTALHFSRMRWDPKNAGWDDRDRFVLSKGHGVPVLYAAYAEAGAIPEEELMTLRKTGSRLQGHPDPTRLPFVEAATGSLGQGLSIALGLALARQARRCLVADVLPPGRRGVRRGPGLGGGDVGAALRARQPVRDRRLQQDPADVAPSRRSFRRSNPLPEKWRAFSWHVIECDGHDIEQVLAAVDEAAATKGKPTRHRRPHGEGQGRALDGELDATGTAKAPKKEQAETWIKEISSYDREEGSSDTRSIRRRTRACWARPTSGSSAMDGDVATSVMTAGVRQAVPGPLLPVRHRRERT